MEFHLFLPQMRLTFDQLVERAQAAEAAGFTGIAGMDHLAPPQAEDQPMYEPQVLSTWLAAHTQRLVLGSLVLADGFRHPALLAKTCVSIDHASQGRYELGIGWGSVVAEFEQFGVEPTAPRDRVARLGESLAIMKALWAGETVDRKGEHFTLRGARQMPLPLGRIPIVIGGSGPKTLALVREHADWWNIHVGILDTYDRAHDQIGDARISMQHMVAFVTDEAQRGEITARTSKRFPHSRPAIGNGAELVDFFGAWRERGVERVYAWFCDFARPETLHAFGDQVIAPLRDR
jgi:alkanesulfonate monooxygenase SsuD/methylene tetrahydromethanopterin reductase-like flavin-dependent oxidoreductase (luciferase family)